MLLSTAPRSLRCSSRRPNETRAGALYLRGAMAESLAETPRAAFLHAVAITARWPPCSSAPRWRQLWPVSVAVAQPCEARSRLPLSRFVWAASRTQRQSPVRGRDELAVVVDQTCRYSGVVQALSAS